MNCSPCSSGKVSSDDRQSCSTCPAGTMAQFDECAACPAGTYSNEGSTVCSLCTAGSYSAPSASSCTECQAGNYALDTTTPCEECSAGKYSAASSALCTPCPPGENSAAGASSCSSCVSGRYSLGVASSCEACVAGTYSAEGAAACTPCGTGKWSSEEASSCTDCVAGKYRLTSPSGCSDCPGGTYTDSDGASACSTCDPGNSAAPGSTSCTLCQAGKYSLIPSDSCSQCSAGKYSLNEGATSCSGCSRGKYSMEGSLGCVDCPPHTYSVEEAGSCYDLAGDFNTCPKHPIDGDVVDNKCKYLYEGEWKSINEEAASPFSSLCTSYSLCEHSSDQFHDEYWISCLECQEGKVAVGYNSATQVRENCSSPSHYPQKCVESSSFSSCPSDPLKEDSCHYFYRGKWEDVGGGDASTFSDSCVDYAVCGATYETVENSYFVLCTQCAPGMLQYTKSRLDGDDGTGADGLPDAGLPPGSEALCSHGEAISYCYDPQEFSTCPSGGSSAENLLIECNYLGQDGGTVRGGDSSPFLNTCDEYELVRMQEGGLANQGSEFVIACTKCKAGLQPGEFGFEDGSRFIGTCYTEVGPGADGDFSTCNVGGVNYGKDVTCTYLSGPSGDAWASVPWGSSAPATMSDGCQSFTVCTTNTTETSIEYHLMCDACKSNHQATEMNSVIRFDGCGVYNQYPTVCALEGVRTPSPTAPPTGAPSPSTYSPTPSPTVDEANVIEQVDGFLTWLSKLATNHLELFMFGIAALVIILGVCVYKCYERDKLKQLNRWEDDGERSMWSFDMESITSTDRGGSSFREVGIQPGGGTSGRRTSGKFSRQSTQELPLMRNSSRLTGRQENYEEDSDAGSEGDDWVERLDPNGKKFYENKKTRRATWTDRAARSPPPPPGGAFNPLRDEESSSSVRKNGLERTRSNTRGANDVPVLEKKPKANPPPPPPPAPNPPPKGWNRAIDQKGREYFWEVETGRTVWNRDDCK
ncbi:hypothetical protein TrCOL_g10698 [Triparma columacea]|uniref:WW domain-containing protein n=1 Tax=Triparma columacea TaxID=722753 RepID=A0A9W7LCJ9_9STRA|nr:hypothetical protein TrCOL_g10698 [Triparma columacea]